ncbi:MAG: MMPL family transporter [Pseudomonadota bacterium]
MHRTKTKSDPAIFRTIIRHPRVLLIATFALIVIAAIGLGGVTKDPSVDAFVPQDHPAAIARDRAADIFGLEDPVVIGLTSRTSESAFTASTLETLVKLDVAIRQIDGVKKNDVISLASQKAMLADNGDLLVEPIIDDDQSNDEAAARALRRFQSMPMLSGVLAAPDMSMLILIAPVVDANNATQTLADIRALVAEATDASTQAHIAGVATMNARLAGMVETDTRIFVPAAIVTVLLILLVALRRVSALTGPLLVIAGSAAVAIGLMGWIGARYYLITTALPVVIMAIAVADALHLSTYFLQARTQRPDFSAAEAVRIALSKAWLPITLTSITTIAAFCGLSFGTAMQPISEFGLFAAVGVAAAWVLSLTALPAVLILTNLQPSCGAGSIATSGWLDRSLHKVTDFAFERPVVSLLATTGVFALLVAFALQARFDYERQRYFTSDDLVLQADSSINRALGGVNFLDVVVTAPEDASLMTPEALQSIAELRGAMAELPLVSQVNGIDSYIAHMHHLLTDAPASTLPDKARAPGQYMFLYEASGEPEDFKRDIDYEHRTALVRAQLSSDNYRATRETVRALEGVVADWTQFTTLKADISGRIAVNTGWMDQLSTNHIKGLLLATALVFLTTWFVFRSFGYAVMAMVPVVFGVICVYATMGALGLDIAPATSMTAAIATGLGVDFGIHLISLIRQQRASGHSTYDAFSHDYFVVARACFYSAIALGVALAVICISSAPVLRWFGLLVSTGAFGSLIGALIILPALWSVVYNSVERNSSYAMSL